MNGAAANQTSAAVDRRVHPGIPAQGDGRGEREWKAARRDVLVQCVGCGAKSTGRVNARRRLVSINGAARFNGRSWCHSICGGHLNFFDIEVVT
jgi:hypothetical protein